MINDGNTESYSSVVTLTLVSHGRLFPGFRRQIWSGLGRVSVSDQPLQPLAISCADRNLLDLPHRRRFAGSRQFVNPVSATEH
jgi:hypothetical protein